MPGILKKILRKINAPIIRVLYGPLEKIKSTRPIEKIDTLVIGDICSDTLLNQYCDLEHSMKLMMPGRSIMATYILLCHFTSVLQEGGKVIVVDGKGKDGLSVYDYPYLSQLTRMGLKMKENGRKMTYPLFFMPLKSLLLLTGWGGDMYKKGKCLDDNIVKLCGRKKFELIYLVK